MIKNISKAKAFGGSVEFYSHASKVNQCEMHFSIFLPSRSKKEKCPVLYWLSGLTCTEENFMVKAGAQEHAEKHGLIIVAPDTSPRGEGIAKGDSWDLGLGAGFYVNATESPWKQNYQMYDYILRELPAIIESAFPVDKARTGIFGHSMGGHGALVLGLRNPDVFRSVSAFAPIVAPSRCPWGEKAFGSYLGSDREKWKTYDATELVAKHRHPQTLLLDFGTQDKFLDDQLKPEFFENACRKADQKLQLRMQEGYDHSYYFISSFIRDHIEHHAKILA